MFRDPTEADPCWVLFDWDEAGWQLRVRPHVPAILKEAGHLSKPEPPTFLGAYERVGAAR